MSLGVSEYSVGNARGTDKYVHGLMKRAKKEGFSRAVLVRDLAQKPSKNLFSDRPSTQSLEALCSKFKQR